MPFLSRGPITYPPPHPQSFPHLAICNPPLDRLVAGLHATSLDVKPCIFIRKAELKVSDALYEVNERITLGGEEVSHR